jgi:hypothetical protein
MKLLVFVIIGIVWISSALAFDPRVEPCWAKAHFANQPIPDDTPIIMVAGHSYRKKDTCLKVHMFADWENKYFERADTWWEISFRFTTGGEIWINEDTKEFSLVTTPTAYQQVPDQIQVSEARGQYCKRRHGNACLEIVNFNKSDLKIDKAPLPAGPVNYTSFVLALPKVSNGDGDEIAPETLQITPPGFKFKSASERWGFDPVAISNLTLNKITYSEIKQALQNHGTLKSDYSYQYNEDPEDRSYNTGKLKLHFQLGCPENLKIVEPVNDALFVFQGDVVGMLMIEFKLELDGFPKEFWGNNVEWITGKPEGSQVTFTPENAAETLLFYNGMPIHNSDFGKRSVAAEVKLNHCGKYHAGADINLFYPRDAHTSPDTTVPNWYYYWKQTSVLEMGAGMDPMSLHYDALNPRCANEAHQTFVPWDSKVVDGNSFLLVKPEISICDLNAMPVPHTHFPVASAEIATNIDAFARQIGRQLFYHQSHKNYWPSGWPVTYVQGYPADLDSDHFPDANEADDGYLSNKFSTHNYSFGNKLYSDLERQSSKMIEQLWVIGDADKEDWAYPGNQWSE